LVFGDVFCFEGDVNNVFRDVLKLEGDVLKAQGGFRGNVVEPMKVREGCGVGRGAGPQPFNPLTLGWWAQSVDKKLKIGTLNRCYPRSSGD
jgi:hypothetical protein